MDRVAVLELLDAVRNGRTDVEVAVERLSVAAVTLAYATVDVHRALRTGIPEVIYASGKTAIQIVGILEALHERGQDGLVTRISAEKTAEVVASLSHRALRWSAEAQVLVSRVNAAPELVGRIAVVSAGTSDIRVSEEAAVVAEALGNHVVRVNDVGVAGIHRVLDQIELLRGMRVIIVVAGMDGALPGVVAGLVRVPVIAVPTSVGYGASFGGVAALLTMLNACSPGVTVVNIDNGFGAAYQASLINQLDLVR
ncbi:MAG: nickel pincer cofactor biosynthesis protein LarB [Pseudomonadota bacterium]|nr:nickel pincer cofactor biosynthesis protein LarB [Pseudomonadota bacterium]